MWKLLGALCKHHSADAARCRAGAQNNILITESTFYSAQRGWSTQSLSSPTWIWCLGRFGDMYDSACALRKGLSVNASECASDRYSVFEIRKWGESDAVFTLNAILINEYL